MANRNSTQPYFVGTNFEITSHTPLSVHEAESQEVSDAEDKLFRAGLEAEAVFHFAGLKSAPPLNPERRRLEITEIISASRDQNAQIVLCNIFLGSEQTDSNLVAKIYDPLYRRQDYFPQSERLSYTKEANAEYSRESAAYQRLQMHSSTFPFEAVPKYHGSWVLELTESASASARGETQHRTRNVCLILIEHIHGSSMESLIRPSNRYDDYDEGYRLLVLSRIIEIETWLNHIGVRHNDIAERNIILDPPPTANDRRSSSLIPRVILIDFGISIVKDSSKSPRPTNPAVTWWKGSTHCCRGWSPKWWIVDLPKRRRWLLTQFGGNEWYAETGDLGDVQLLSMHDKRHLQRYGA